MLKRGNVITICLLSITTVASITYAIIENIQYTNKLEKANQKIENYSKKIKNKDKKIKEYSEELEKAKTEYDSLLEKYNEAEKSLSAEKTYNSSQNNYSNNNQINEVPSTKNNDKPGIVIDTPDEINTELIFEVE